MNRLFSLALLSFLCSAEAGEAERAAPADTVPAERTLSAVEIQEWPVPYTESRPRDPFVGPDGRVWFVGQRAHYVAVFDPSTAEFRRYDLPQGTGPHNLIVDPSGVVWYAGNLVSLIGRLDPESGAIETFPMPDPAIRDPHTLVFDTEGTIWFTAQMGNRVGRFDPQSGEVELVEVPTPSARPYGIVPDGRGRVWVAELGTNRIGVLDAATMAYREIVLPRSETRSRRLAITPDGTIWYVDYAAGKLGRIDPESEEIQEWDAPAGASSRPYAMAADSAGRLWFVETGPQPNRFVGFDPATGAFTEPVSIASGGGSVRHMHFDKGTNAIWFGTDANTLGRAKLPD